MTDIEWKSSSESEVFVIRWRHKSGTLKVIGQFKPEGIGCKAYSQNSLWMLHDRLYSFGQVRATILRQGLRFRTPNMSQQGGQTGRQTGTTILPNVESKCCECFRDFKDAGLKIKLPYRPKSEISDTHPSPPPPLPPPPPRLRSCFCCQNVS